MLKTSETTRITMGHSSRFFWKLLLALLLVLSVFASSMGVPINLGNRNSFAAPTTFAANLNNLYTWGYNSFGQLGNGTTTDSHNPIQITLASGVTPITIAAGQSHSLAIGSDNNLYAWGVNGSGALGDGTTTQRNSPEKITLAAGVSPIAIISGGLHNLAIGSDNNLYAWGDNSGGELGDGTTTDSHSPEKITLAAGVSPIAIANGEYHSLAIGSDHNLYMWGDNTYGQLGDGTTNQHNSPEKITLAAGVTPIAISASYYHNLAIGSDNNLYAWGDNAAGDLGDGTTNQRNSPEKITLAAGVSPIAISAGEYHCLVIGSDNNLYVWGDNAYGQLGDGTTNQRNSPEKITLAAGVTPITVSAGGNHSLGIGSNSKLYAWGDNVDGDLGDGTTNQQNSPEAIGIVSAGSVIAANNVGDFSMLMGRILTATTTSLTNNPNPSTYGQNVTFTATVAPAAATGSITFTIGTANVSTPLNGGTATYVTNTLPVGSTVVTATYSGDNNYVSSSATTTQVVVTASPTIAVSAGNGQSTPISTTFPITLQAIVRNGSTGQALAGATVVFQAPASGASGFFSPTNSTIFTATTNTNGVATASAFVANGTVGSYQVTASTAGAASPATFNLVNNPAGTTSGYTYYLPFLANNANNFTTYLVFQNTANVSSTVAISFYDNNGNAVAAASGTCSSVAALGECIVPNPFANGKQGEGIIVSQQSLNVIVSEATPYGGSAYAVSAGASNNLIAPVAIKGGLVDFTTQLSIFNGGNSSVNGTVQFFDQNGNHVIAADKSFNLPAHSTTIYDQSQDNTLANFYGWAQINSPAGSQLVAQTLEQRPSVKFVAIVNAQFNPQTTLYAPAIFNNAFGSFITGANLVNPNSQPVTVSITYYKNDGTATTTAPFTIPANAVTGIFQGGTSGNGLPQGGLPNNWYGAATVKVTGGSGIIMFVNEQGGLTATGSDQSGTYGAAVSGSSTVGLPVMANGAFGGYITGATVENITSSPVTATVQYYDLNGNAVGTVKTVTIGGNASAALYQGGSDQALQNGFYGTAQITVTGGPSSSLLVTTNAQSNAFFYSYTEPNF